MDVKAAQTKLQQERRVVWVNEERMRRKRNLEEIIASSSRGRLSTITAALFYENGIVIVLLLFL